MRAKVKQWGIYCSKNHIKNTLSKLNQYNIAIIMGNCNLLFCIEFSTDFISTIVV